MTSTSYKEHGIIHPRRATAWTVVGALFALAGAGYLVGTAWRSRSADAVGAWAEPYEPSPNVSDEFNAAASWINNDLARMRRPWTAEIAERLAAIIAEGYSEEYTETVATRPGATIRDVEPMMLYDMAVGVVIERLRHDEPMTPEARRILTEALIDTARRPHWRIRSSAIGSLIESGLVENPWVRALIVAMQDDPNPVVAANARKHLTNYDEYKATLAAMRKKP
ncbi:MAG: hypothetical protein D6693_06520 [Planctomycetota bacterium]|nr:MAG: hypothetical protein D6693_06520 [Planctomycetota bacterium]